MNSSSGSSKDLSKSFCVYPWIEQVVQSNGKMSFCCVAKGGGMVMKEDGSGFRAGTDSLADAWNSDHMRSIRQGMLEGKQVAGCELCYFQESIGKTSYREMHNEEWLNKARAEIETRVEASQASDFRVDKPALYLDLRLGNLCNLKCRSCNPFNSSQIHKEVVQLHETNSEYRDFWNRFNGGKKPADTPEWYESDLFWDEVIRSIPNLRKVYLTGGEPTLIERNYKFMQACIESGHAKNIFLMFNINCTNVQDKFLEYLPHFQFVLINASIDGLEQENEYIRFLSRWETIDKNFRKLVKLPSNVQIGVTPVLQIYNVLTITRLLDYIESIAQETGRDLNVDFLYATDPNYINVQILPPSVKQEAIRRLEQYKARSKTYQTQRFLKNSIDSCINLLNEQPVADADKMKDFVAYTRMLDVHRKQRLELTLPDLGELLKSEGYIIHG